MRNNNKRSNNITLTQVRHSIPFIQYHQSNYLPVSIHKYIVQQYRIQKITALKQGIPLHIHRYVHMYQHPIAKSQQAFAMEACRCIPCVGGDHQLTLSVSVS